MGRARISRLATALALIVAMVAPAGVWAQDEGDPDRFELVEDLDLGFPVTINQGTCDSIVPEPVVVLGIADPLPILEFINEAHPLFNDDPEEDELTENVEGLLGQGTPPADPDLLAPEAPPIPIVWKLTEELELEFDDLTEVDHVVVVYSGEDQITQEARIVCGEIAPATEDGDSGEIAVPLRQVGGSLFAGIALFEQVDGFPIFGDDHIEVELYVFHGLSAVGAPPLATPGAATPAAPTPTPAAAETPEVTATPAQTPEAGQADPFIGLPPPPGLPPESAATPEAVTVTPTPAGAPPASPAVSPTAPPAGDGQAAEEVTIEMVDIDFNPNEVTIPANTDVAIHLPNNGAVLHNFSVTEKNNPQLPIPPIDVDVQPGQSQTITVNMPPGDYYFFCDIPGHEAAGMYGTLHVQ